MELLYPKENPVFEKYDEYVPEELIRKEGVSFRDRVYLMAAMYVQGREKAAEKAENKDTDNAK